MELKYSLPAPKFARQLIGYELIVTDKSGQRGGIITETEAYTANDPASHSYKGPSQRNRAMFMAPGTLYIYRIYGIHYCLNIVCGNSDGQAVLLRALRPTVGVELMKVLRRTADTSRLCDGPAKLVQALGLEHSLNTSHIQQSKMTLTAPAVKPTVSTGKRIGITKATDTLWRFYEIHTSK